MKALRGLPIEEKSVIAGLGGRAVTRASLAALFEKALRGELGDETHFLDLDRELVEKELERERSGRHIGPVAEALNRHVAERHLARGEEI